MWELPISIADVVIFIVLLISAAHAASRGFLSEVLSIVAWVAATIATVNLYHVAKPIAQANIENELIANVAALIGLFFIILIPLSFISYRVSQNVKSSQAGPLDQTLGFVFGLIRGLVVLALAYIMLTAMVPIERQPEWLTQARLLPLVQATGNVILSVVPESVRENIDEESLASQKRDPDSEYSEKDRRALDDLIQKSR